MDPEVKDEVIDGYANTAAWPVCWLLLRPSPADPLHPGDVVVPLHIDTKLPDYLVLVHCV